MRKVWDIHGGVHPPENKMQSLRQPIGSLPLAHEIILPLSQHIGAPATPKVRVGDKVLKGQLIAEAVGIFSASVHASTSGIVSAIEDRSIPHPSGFSAPCIIITPDGRDEWMPLTECEDWQSLSHKELIEKIRAAGLSGMGGAGFPTSVKLNPKSTNKITTLILNGTECEPYITADDILMREHAQEVIQGALLLAHIIGQPQEILIGIEDNKPEAIAALQKACLEIRPQHPVEIVSFPTKYPSGGEKQLIQILTGKEVPSGKLPADLGILVQNVGTAYAAWRAIRYGEPLVERITTVVGKALQQERNVRVPLGTPISHILEHHGFHAEKSSRLIIGGPMMGYSVEQTQIPVIKTTNCLLIPSNDEMPDAPPAQACIRCGMCAEACPAQLLPQQLFWYAQAEDSEKLKSHNLFDCIECGACSYVCPSAIPLVQYYRAAKGSIRLHEAEKQKSDQARLRFEKRKERIEKAEAAKEEKRLIRKIAAEEAKKKLAEKKANELINKDLSASAPDIEKANIENTDLVANAVARAKENSDDPESQRKKLARALSSAQSRLDRIIKQLEEDQSDEGKADKLRAQHMQAQLKVKEAQEKLDALGLSGMDLTAMDLAKDEATASPQDTPLTERLQQMEAKLNASPLETQRKAVEKIAKTLEIAKQKVLEAEAEGKPSVDALKAGVDKLVSKLDIAKSDLEEMEASSDPAILAVPEQDAAASAIAKAQAKAAAQATMSPEAKRQMQIDSLQQRIAKAKEKLSKAKAEGSEHVAVLTSSLENLEAKLAEFEH